MATAPSRKKSLIGQGNNLPVIDIPQGNNQLLNKAASSSTSLYQQCSQLRAKLMRIHFFAPFLTLAAPLPSSSNRQSHSTDPVRQLWDCFSLGTPLCFLYNLLPGRSPLNVNTNPDEFDPENLKERKHATAKFIIAITAMKNDGEWGSTDVFTISELHSETRDTNGFVKVRRRRCRGFVDPEIKPVLTTIYSPFISRLTGRQHHHQTRRAPSPRGLQTRRGATLASIRTTFRRRLWHAEPVGFNQRTRSGAERCHPRAH
ncbi:hypothetical protein FRB93_005417 [Tulasnella sp. JGI-2019a]|nr:hypothetical protein FRB93_005417 [Tulasnella sp. JGI-2019a]